MSAKIDPAVARRAFNEEGGAAEGFAAQLGLTMRAPAGERRRSERFSYFVDEHRFLIVVGGQERRSTDLALAHGLSQRGQQQLTLILPREHAFATLQRAAWLTDEARPEVWVHDGTVAARVDVPSPERSLQNLREFVAARPAPTPDGEFTAATTPTYLGDRAPSVVSFVEWATQHPHLDPSHRQGERAWHCMGLRVLSLRVKRGGGLKIRGGVHWKDETKSPAVELDPTDELDERARAVLDAGVKAGITARLQGHPELRSADDEHWLQAVLRRRPEIVGLEQPALREVPAWRPIGGETETGFRRGYVDLVGLDGHGDVRLVETKLSSNVDDLLVFQGLDYFIWAEVYAAPLRARLGAPTESRLVLHYVLGADPKTQKAHVSPYLRAQVDALSPEVAWRFQVVDDWFRPDDPWSGTPATSRLLPAGLLPGDEAAV